MLFFKCQSGFWYQGFFCACCCCWRVVFFFFLCRTICLCLCYKKTSMVRQETFFPSMTLTRTCSTSPGRWVFLKATKKKKCQNTKYLRTYDRYKNFSCLCQGDGNIRYYEISSEKPYIHYLTEYRSNLPQKGMGKTHTPPHSGTIFVFLNQTLGKC